MNNNQRYGVLQLFAPDGAENAQTGDSTADAGQRATADGEEFETLIKGRFKEPFAKKTQAIIDKRFREYKSLESYRDRVRPLIGDLLARYDLQEGDEETLAELLRDETPAGADVPTEPTDPDGDGGERRDALLEALHDWAGQESALRELYPDFDLRAELRGNPVFGNLLLAGVPLGAAYETAHRDEVLGSAMAYAADRAREDVVRGIEAKGMRPLENGVQSESAAVSTVNVNALTSKDILKILKQVENGASVSF